MAEIWKCCDCKKFVQPGVIRCLSCSIDHGALKKHAAESLTPAPTKEAWAENDKLVCGLQGNWCFVHHCYPSTCRILGHGEHAKPAEPSLPVEGKDKGKLMHWKDAFQMSDGIYVPDGKGKAYLVGENWESLDLSILEAMPSPMLSDEDLEFNIKLCEGDVALYELQKWRKFGISLRRYSLHDAEPKPTPSTPELCMNEDCDSNHICFQPKGHKTPCYGVPSVQLVTDCNQLKSSASIAEPDSWTMTDDIKAITVAIIEGREVPNVSGSVFVRNLVWAIQNRLQPQPSSISTERSFAEWWFDYDERDRELPSRYEAAKAAWAAAKVEGETHD